MITSQFIEISGKQADGKTDHIFNIARINSICKVTTVITDGNRRSYDGFPLVDDKAYSIVVYMSGPGGMELIYPSEAIRDASFEAVRKALNPTRISRGNVLDSESPSPSTPTPKPPRKPRAKKGEE